jgi:uncharacterized protein
MQIVSIYAALLALLFVVLSVRTLRMRRRLRVAVGDGGSTEMLRAMRAHSNFAEYVPLSLLLFFLVEQGGANAIYVHGLCLSLLVGRLSHSYGVSQVEERMQFRVIGMVLTLTPLVAAATRLLFAGVGKSLA